MKANCRIDLQELKEQIDTSEFTPQRKDELRNRVNAVMQNVLAHSSEMEKPASDVAVRAQQRLANQLRSHQATYLSPHLSRNFQHFLAQQFGVTKKLLGLGDAASIPGSVRESLVHMRRLGAGSMKQLFADMQLVDLAIQADTLAKQVRKKYNIPSREFEFFKMDLAEMPHHPYLQTEFNLVSPAAIEMLRGRQQRIKLFVERHNISVQDLDKLSDAFMKVTDTMEEVGDVMRKMNINLGDASTDFNSYVARQFNPDAVDRITYLKEKGNGLGIIDGETGAFISGREAFTKSRATQHYIPEDAPLLEFALLQADPKLYEHVSVDLTKRINNINDLLSDNGALTHAFVNYLDKKTPELFDSLVDSGLINKIPMTSTEVYDYILKRYGELLPFKNLSELVQVDFTGMASVYKRQVEEMMGRHFASTFTAREAIEGRWGVSSWMVKASPDLYKGFVPLVGAAHMGDSVVERTGAIPKRFAERFKLQGPEFESIFVHPVVADNIQSMLEIATSPNKLALLATSTNVIKRTFSRLLIDALDISNKVFVRQALATTGFVSRQMMNNAFMTVAAGANLTTYVNDSVRLLYKMVGLGAQRRSIENLAEMFDDTRKIYGGLTERQLWVRMKQEGLIQDIMPIVGSTDFNPTNYRPKFLGIQNQARYYASLWKSVDDVSDLLVKVRLSADQAARGAVNFSDQFFYLFHVFGQTFDQIARFSTVKSLMASPMMRNGQPGESFSRTLRQRAFAAVEGPIGRKAFGNFQATMDYDRAVNHMQRYFHNFDTMGDADNVVNKYIIPFYSFHSRNTFAIFKKMLREPHSFVAYHRIYAALNERAESEGEDYPAAGEPDWLTKSSPIRWVIPDDGDGLPDVFAIPMTAIDPVAEGVNKVSDTLDGFLSIFGFEQPMSPEQRLQARLNSRTNQTLQEMVASAYPLYKTAYAAITNVNPQTGRSFPVEERRGASTSFLGFKNQFTTPFWTYMWETNFPILARVHNANPGGVFGIPPKFDNQGNLVSPGKVSWLGNSRDRADVVRDYRTWWQQSAQWAGVNIVSVDVVYNMGYQETALSIALSQADKDIDRQRRFIEQSLNRQERPEFIEQAQKDLIAMLDVYTQLQLDLQDILAWRDERGLDTERALRLIREQNLMEEVRGTAPIEDQYNIINNNYGEFMNYGTDNNGN